MGEIKKVDLLKDYVEDMITFLVVRRAFEAVGYFFWPLYYRNESEEYMNSAHTVISPDWYDFNRDIFKWRGSELFCALMVDKNFKMLASDVEFREVVKDARCRHHYAAFFVSEYIKNPESVKLKEHAQSAWRYCLRDDIDIFFQFK